MTMAGMELRGMMMTVVVPPAAADLVPLVKPAVCFRLFVSFAHALGQAWVSTVRRKFSYGFTGQKPFLPKAELFLDQQREKHIWRVSVRIAVSPRDKPA